MTIMQSPKYQLGLGVGLLTGAITILIGNRFFQDPVYVTPICLLIIGIILFVVGMRNELKEDSK